jgi:hypothetical protein
MCHKGAVPFDKIGVCSISLRCKSPFIYRSLRSPVEDAALRRR